MARTPYQPFSETSTAVPGPTYQNIQASPEAFGAAVGRGLQRVGQGAESASSSLFQGAVALQDRYNQVATDQGYNDLSKGYFDLTYGPNGIFSKHGADALNARQPTIDAMDQLKQSILSKMPNDAVRVGLEMAARRLQLYTMESIGRHTDAEYQRYNLDVNKATFGNEAQTIGAAYNDENMYGLSHDKMVAAAVRNAQVQYGDDLTPEQTQAAVREANTAAVRARVLPWAVKDPVAASKWLETQREGIDPNVYATLSSHLRAMNDDAAVAAGINSLHGTSSTENAVRSNNVGNIRASGIQWTGKGSPVGGFETFDTPEHGVMAATQNLLSYARENGGQITLAQAINKWAPPSENNTAAYIARVSAQTGIAPDQPLPLGNADKTAAVVKAMAIVEHGGTPFSDDVFRRGAAAAIGTQTPSSQGSPSAPSGETPFGAEFGMMQAARAKARELFPDRPDLQNRMVSGRWQEIQEANVLQARDLAMREKAQKDAQQKAYNEAVTQIMTDPGSFDPKVVGASGVLTGQQKESLWAFHKEFADRLNGGGPTAAVSHAFATHLMADIRSGAITDMQPIFDAYTNQHLTNADFSFLQQQFQQAKTPDGQRLDHTVSEFLQSVKSSIIKANPIMGTLDMTGGTLFFQLQQDIAKKVSDYRKEGKDPYDLFDPSKPDYVGRPEALAPYQRSMAESMDQVAQRLRSGTPPPSALPVAPAASVPRAPGTRPSLLELSK